ncbi:unnamed protein product [Dimorphilus gyrociliatus]|uniref:Uncharacterized protein n=1 Tax=Dimorphilus gyrociliatus TaxID=2664684 RepID=A0A7I8WE10_9ANNE|nr:unnamed protein product [Dimorphilus gyrociliatus]
MVQVDLGKDSVVFAVTVIGSNSIEFQIENLRIGFSKNSNGPTSGILVECGYKDGIVPDYFTMRCPQWTIGHFLSTIIDPQSITKTLVLCQIDVF